MQLCNFDNKLIHACKMYKNQTSETKKLKLITMDTLKNNWIHKNEPHKHQTKSRLKNCQCQKNVNNAINYNNIVESQKINNLKNLQKNYNDSKRTYLTNFKKKYTAKSLKQIYFLGTCNIKYMKIKVK
ncbi:hypothetical protein A3Q56_02357 [Intoshia linei]|uniref:Uncharacterized protein n=1 Tax=Intoshia linei TaxID=1819745 RepID=A0A177B8A1_9BILA|nr:hypothetical protein A3Q56_02357 [Intoshia linei]